MTLDRSHFREEDWVDYVRGTLPEDRRPALQGHLDAGCSTCVEMHDLWTAVQASAPADQAYEPPAGALRVARALFGLHRPAGRLARAIEAATLLFDSRLMPATAGLRSASTVPRKLVYAIGKHVVDIQFQDDENGRPTQLIGQVTTEDADAAFEDSPVLLLREMQVIARATMNRLGEFHMEFDGVASGLSLALGLKRGGTVINLDTTRT